MIEVIAYGQPAPQGSKSYKGTSGGKGIMVESSKYVKPWRDDVKAAAETAIRDHALAALVGVPLTVRMIFTVRKPAAAPKRRRTWPAKRPDLSKLIRSTEDALTAAGLWGDDALVVEYERTAKVYPGEDPEALDRPGVRITIRTLTEEEPVR